MTPLQAALGVRQVKTFHMFKNYNNNINIDNNNKCMLQGLRPDVPTNTDPKLVELMQRGWDSDPDNRPSFSEIKIELEGLLKEIQVKTFGTLCN